jgi:hypothetical protein
VRSWSILPAEGTKGVRFRAIPCDPGLIGKNLIADRAQRGQKMDPYGSLIVSAVDPGGPSPKLEAMFSLVEGPHDTRRAPGGQPWLNKPHHELQKQNPGMDDHLV